MFDYHYNGEQKHTLIIGQLSYYEYKINIIYEDYETADEKLHILTNIRDFFDTESNVIKIKNQLKNQLSKHFEKEYMDVKWKIPKYIQNLIMNKIDIL